MISQINMIGIITNDLTAMKHFYTNILGFPIKLEVEGNYVEFENEGVRFALSTGEVMAKATGEPGYLQPGGHHLELAFAVDSTEEVDTTYAELIKQGARGIKEPADMPWNQRTAFFADPDGNIHEIFADL